MNSNLTLSAIKPLVTFAVAYRQIPVYLWQITMQSPYNNVRVSMNTEWDESATWHLRLYTLCIISSSNTSPFTYPGRKWKDACRSRSLISNHASIVLLVIVQLSIKLILLSNKKWLFTILFPVILPVSQVTRRYNYRYKYIFATKDN